MGLQRCPGGSVGRYPLADLCQALLALALHGQCPPTHEHSIGCPLWKALLGRKREGSLCVLMYGWYVAAKLGDPGCHNPREPQTIGV